ncbi:hypothetical protein J3Q64DRAFT_1636886 [Phycomyces blakesleeanus]|uniref:EamA domain-containing protein n=2 Tax=Phycomyces blakesleeanus TaxID=4837 RepID=A0A162PVM8_PHYB8|nr:hypothetical protein PHYBLDRAFT_154986 [Phycomyces blakesleeanus NRRL 1555(-)]OAD76427.1 hypothetical protein PHYBLDRAFT_154986 [Phycomyces blakesleeanus NRRL 1555(-)]|eukprot:XP_018294467.1 hypothetical protein PHYBLDRAFT_154986 [Phycomyces blakesleeanus NRRL 1555(-)]
MIEQSRRRYICGILILLVVVLIWVSSSFTMNSIFGDQKYNKPFLVTYINTTTFSFYLIPLLIFRKKKQYQPEEIDLEDSARLLGDHESEDNQEFIKPQNPPQIQLKLSDKETIKLSLMFCLLWFGANYTNNASLAYTSVGSSTILSSMSGLFTLVIGAIFKVEKVTWIKVAAICISFSGVVLVSYSDQLAEEHAEHPSALIGDLLSLMGAFFYGAYTTLLKLKIGDESRINIPLFFGCVGLFNFALLWPLFPIFHWLKIETFQLPMSGSLWAMIGINAFVGTFLSDYLWILAMFMTSPLVVTIGVSLTIPLALMVEIIFKHHTPAIQYAIGAILVIVGFFIVNLATLSLVKKEDKESAVTNEIQ